MTTDAIVKSNSKLTVPYPLNKQATREVKKMLLVIMFLLIGVLIGLTVALLTEGNNDNDFIIVKKAVDIQELENRKKEFDEDFYTSIEASTAKLDDYFNRHKNNRNTKYKTIKEKIRSRKRHRTAH